MPLQDSVALVTGAGGFVGANLVRRLIAERAIVHTITRTATDAWRLAPLLDGLTSHHADLTDGDAVKQIVARVRPDLIFHLAKHRGNPATLSYAAAYAANLHATLHLLEAAQDQPLVRFVHAGSSLEYDLTHSPLREADAPAPRTVHGVTKAAATLLCQHFAVRHGVPAVVLRFFTVYGPWEGPSRFVPRLMMAALGGPALEVTRDGLAHDWIFVDDVVDACVRAAGVDQVNGEIVNVATGRQSTNDDLVRIVGDLAGALVPRAADPFPSRPWDTGHWVADVTRARERLGWQAAVDLRTGLARTLDWFRAHRPLYLERQSG